MLSLGIEHMTLAYAAICTTELKYHNAFITCFYVNRCQKEHIHGYKENTYANMHTVCLHAWLFHVTFTLELFGAELLKVISCKTHDSTLYVDDTKVILT